MSTIERTTNKRRRWPAWSGSISELRRISVIFEGLCEARRAAFLAAFDNETLEILENIDDAIERDVKQHTRARQREEITRSLLVIATIVDGDDKVAGPVAEILEEIDRRTVQTVAFSLKSASHELRREDVSITFTRSETSWRSGVSLEVQSTDQGWGRQVFAGLSEEIEKGVPAWSWVQTTGGSIVIFTLMCASLIAGSSLCLIPIIWPPKEVSQVLAISIGISLMSVYPSMFLSGHKVRTWLCPQFELLGETGGASQVRRLTFLTTIAIPIPIGILINLIT